MRTRLLDLLVKHSYRYDASEPFRLSSGRRSAFYVNCKATTMQGEAFDLVGALVAEHLPPGIEAVGGLTLGADPIAHATASYCTRHGRPLRYFVVRKEAKAHGTGQQIEGGLGKGTAVAVVDDVVTTGASTIEAIRRCQSGGLVVKAVVVLVDRLEDDGLRKIEEAAGNGVPVRAIFTRTDLEARAHGNPDTARVASRS